MVSPSIVIAVVEDDPSILRCFQRLLSSRGYGVELFPSGEYFLSAAGLSQAACAMIDVDLGDGISGFDLARELSSWAKPIPFLLMSGSPDDSFPRRAAELGSVAFLSKPFAEEELIAALDRVVAAKP